MKRLAILASMILFSIASLQGAQPKQLNIIDYFLRLPPKYFDGPPADWLGFLRQRNCGVVDVEHGYISCFGDGAQPGFEVALFRYCDGGPLLAVCSNELEGPNSVYLDFFEVAENGKMRKAGRSIFPVSDAGNDKGSWRFELPRHGKTVLVRNQSNRKIQRKLRWNGERFLGEK